MHNNLIAVFANYGALRNDWDSTVMLTAPPSSQLNQHSSTVFDHCELVTFKPQCNATLFLLFVYFVTVFLHYSY